MSEQTVGRITRKGRWDRRYRWPAHEPTRRHLTKARLLLYALVGLAWWLAFVWFVVNR